MSFNEETTTDLKVPSIGELLSRYCIDLIQVQDKILRNIEDGYIQNKDPESLLSEFNNKKGNPKRPQNANIIFSNLSQKLGTLEIAGKACEEYKLSMRRKMTIARQLSGSLWNKLPSEKKEPFNELARKVDKLHKEKFPEYKLVKGKRNKKDNLLFKHCTGNDKSKPKKRSTKITQTRSSSTLPKEESQPLSFIPSEEALSFTSDSQILSSQDESQISPSTLPKDESQSLSFFTLPKDESDESQSLSFTQFSSKDESQTLISIPPMEQHLGHACRVDNPINAHTQHIFNSYTPSNEEQFRMEDGTFPTFIEPSLGSPLCVDMNEFHGFNRLNYEVTTSFNVSSNDESFQQFLSY